MSKKDEKTNVMRVLEQKQIEFESFIYDPSETNAVNIAKALGEDPASVFKTLVTVGKSKEHYVFMIPSNEELDLKKAAMATGEKSIEMIPQKELLPLTGYIHGGCSPIGMKKQFDTFIDETAILFDRICFSGGRVGFQVRVRLDDLKSVVDVKEFDLVKS
ncbi:MAG: Cys-tRNA(Pro) deacylase [Ruminococcaceae bacterium]|nr:Cys-tRNA(Pro) deacylase [Oscillospiraceae bacterium]